MKTIKVKRNWGDENQSLGNCTVFSEDLKPIFTSLSLERGWRNNENNISCIPKGTYPVMLEFSSRFKKDLWEIKNVPNRAECKFHAANYWHQLNGCIALGQTLADLNQDGYNDITNSGMTMKKFHEAMGSDKRATLIVE